MLATLLSNFAYFKYLVNLYKSFKITSVWLSQLFVLFSLSQNMLCLSYAHTYKQIISETFFCAMLAKILGAAPALSALPTIVVNH